MVVVCGPPTGFGGHVSNHIPGIPASDRPCTLADWRTAGRSSLHRRGALDVASCARKSDVQAYAHDALETAHAVEIRYHLATRVRLELERSAADGIHRVAREKEADAVFVNIEADQPHKWYHPPCYSDDHLGVKRSQMATAAPPQVLAASPGRCGGGQRCSAATDR